MNKFKLLLIFLICLAICVIIFSQCAEAHTRDAWGRVIVDEAVMGAAEADNGIEPQMFDLGLTLGAAGSNDDTSLTEAAIMGISLWWYPNVHPTRKWLQIGARANWDTVDRSKVEFSILPDFLPFSSETSAMLVHIQADVLPHFTVRTEPNEASTSAWSWKPGATIAAEYPMGNYGILVGVGANRILTQEGISDDKITELSAGAQIRLRLGR